MNEYLILLLGGHAGHDAMKDDDRQAYYRQWGEYVDGLAATGALVKGDPLERSGKLIQGDFSRQLDWTPDPTRAVGGYMIVSAGSIEEAVGMMANCPIFAVGGDIEIRPVEKM